MSKELPVVGSEVVIKATKRLGRVTMILRSANKEPVYIVRPNGEPNEYLYGEDELIYPDGEIAEILFES